MRNYQPSYRTFGYKKPKYVSPENSEDEWFHQKEIKNKDSTIVMDIDDYLK